MAWRCARLALCAAALSLGGLAAASADECAAAGLDAEACAAAAGAAAGAKAAALVGEAEAAVRAKNYRRAVQLYGEALFLDASNAEIAYGRARAHGKAGSAKAEVLDLTRAIELRPDHSSALAFRGKAFLTLGDCASAARDFEAVLRIKPSHGDASKQQPRASECARQVGLAEQLVQQRRFDAAERVLNEVMELTGKAPLIMLMRARSRFAEGKVFESIADCGDVLKRDPDSLDALALRGRGYYAVADHEMAQRHFREMLSKDPEHEEGKEWFRRVQRLVKLHAVAEDAAARQRWDDALQALADALAVDPAHDEFNKKLLARACDIRAQLKQVAQAREACEAAIRLAPQDVGPYIALADLLLRTAEETPQFEEALRAWQRASEANREDARVREGLHKAEAGLRQSKQKNYYKILGVPRDADTKDVKKAYRGLAMEFHPDRHGDKNEEERAALQVKFELVAEAYEVLSNQELRHKYDNGQEVFENQGNQGHPHHHFQRRGFNFGNFHFQHG